ncbi:hypothetical protein DCO58_09890 [Helicobacter saguini]|nr:hypothetical protein [Helicobacter saguini]MWV61381.1 hypothetical protein [Helicobacter saguini]MWV67950.1 hypothetical protein [Helicobacter saguini]
MEIKQTRFYKATFMESKQTRFYKNTFLFESKKPRFYKFSKITKSSKFYNLQIFKSSTITESRFCKMGGVA